MSFMSATVTERPKRIALRRAQLESQMMLPIAGMQTEPVKASGYDQEWRGGFQKSKTAYDMTLTPPCSRQPKLLAAAAQWLLEPKNQKSD